MFSPNAHLSSSQTFPLERTLEPQYTAMSMMYLMSTQRKGLLSPCMYSKSFLLQMHSQWWMTGVPSKQEPNKRVYVRIWSPKGIHERYERCTFSQASNELENHAPITIRQSQMDVVIICVTRVRLVLHGWGPIPSSSFKLQQHHWWS